MRFHPPPPPPAAGRVRISGALTFAGGLSLACTQLNPSLSLALTVAAAATVASVTACTVSFCCTFSSTGAVRELTFAVIACTPEVTVFVRPTFSSSSCSRAPVRRATLSAASVSCSRSTPYAKSSITFDCKRKSVSLVWANWEAECGEWEE